MATVENARLSSKFQFSLGRSFFLYQYLQGYFSFAQLGAWATLLCLGKPAWGRPGLVKVDIWISPATDLPLIPTLPTREERLATGVWIEIWIANPRGVKGPFPPVIAPGGMIHWSSDWIAGFTADVSW